MVIARRAMFSHAATRVVRRLTDLRDEWDALLAESEHTSVFQTYAWISEWWATYGLIRDLRVLEVRSHSGLLIGLAPLMIEPPHRLGDKRILSMVGGWATGHHSLISRTGWTSAVCEAVCEFAASRAGWQSVRFHALPDPWPKELENALWRLGLSGALIELDNQSPELSIDGGANGYLASLPKGDRHEIGRKLRRWKASPGTQSSVASSAVDVAPAFRTLLELNWSRWGMQGLHVKNPVAYLRRRRFLRRAVARLAVDGRVHIHTNSVDGAPAAGVLCLDHGDCCYAYMTGFDDRYASYSPGIVAFVDAIEAAASRGRSRFNFICGEHDYKYRLGATNRPLSRWILDS